MASGEDSSACAPAPATTTPTTIFFTAQAALPRTDPCHSCFLYLVLHAGESSLCVLV